MVALETHFHGIFRPDVAALRRPLVCSKLPKQIECRYTHQSAAHKNKTRAHCQVQTLSSEGILTVKDANCHIQARKDEQQAPKRAVNPSITRGFTNGNTRRSESTLYSH